MILFPEYGIYPPLERKDLKDYLEFIPNPKQVHVTPCDEFDLLSYQPILQTLSCIAKNNEIVVIANLGGIEPCDFGPHCPEDGVFHLNTNVAFNQNGTLVARYYKERLFFEPGMDVPKENQDPVVETNFGKFAMFICFDILFQKMATISQMAEIDGILFSTMWFNSSPFYTSIQWWQAWSMGNNATMLAANIQMPANFSTGSGIYFGRKGSAVSVFNPDGVSKLLIATVPRRNGNISSTTSIIIITENDAIPWEDDRKDTPSVCSYSILGTSENIHNDYRCVNENVSNYTLEKLSGTEGHLEVCSAGMCCELDYARDSMNESFYLGVYNGTHSSFNKYFWSEENCFLARCDDINGTLCSHFVMNSETLFHKISLKANFTSEHIYPSVVSTKMRLVPIKNWSFQQTAAEASIEFNSNIGIRLLVATLKGRAYDRDPPYVY